MGKYTMNDLVRLGATRDSLELAKSAIEQKLDEVNQQLAAVAEDIAGQIPDDEVVEVPPFEDNYPELELLDAA